MIIVGALNLDPLQRSSTWNPRILTSNVDFWGFSRVLRILVWFVVLLRPQIVFQESIKRTGKANKKHLIHRIYPKHFSEFKPTTARTYFWMELKVKQRENHVRFANNWINVKQRHCTAISRINLTLRFYFQIHSMLNQRRKLSAVIKDFLLAKWFQHDRFHSHSARAHDSWWWLRYWQNVSNV